MSASWKTAPLGELMRQRPPDVKVEATERYQFAGVYSFARGVFRAQERMGTETSYRVLSRLAAGEFVYPKLMAWEGGFGVVPQECDGCYVSPEFPVFEIDQRKMLPRWIDLFFKVTANWKAIAGVSTGTNMRRQRLQPSDLLTNTIPLPPLAEQRRIVGRIDALASKINEARGLRKEATAEAAAVWQRCARELLMKFPTGVPRHPLHTLITMRGGGTPSKSEPRFWLGTIPWITPKDMKQRELSDSIDHISLEATNESPAKLIEPGAVLVVVRGMILAHTFPVAILRKPAAINQDMKALVPSAALSADYLASALWALNRDVLDLVDRSTHDTRKLLTDKLEALPIPVPPLTEQRRFVAELNVLQAKVDAVKRLQAETAAELDALLPAILDRAFKGEL